MDTPNTVSFSKFIRNFRRLRIRAQREAVAVSHRGQITGYFIGAAEYEQYKRFRESRRSFATTDLPKKKVKAIGASRMDARHRHLDKLLDPK